MIKGKRDVFVFGVLFLASFAVYFPALSNYFINDDFIHLDFVKNFEGDYLDFFFPHLRPSDPVTHARYEPFHIYFYALLYKIFGAFFPAYQFLHIVLHALNAFWVYKIGRYLKITASGAFAAALFFTVYRLNSQNVLWYAALFTTAASSLLLGAFLLFLKPSRAGGFLSVTFFFAAALLSLRAPQSLPLAGAYLWIFKRELQAENRLGTAVKTFLGYAAVSAFSIGCNLINWRYFPNRIPGFEFDFFSLAAFFLNLIVPYEIPLLIKYAALFLFFVFVFTQRKDQTAAFLSLAIMLNGAFWFLVFSASHLPYAPRYFYLAAALFSLLLGHGFSRLSESAAPLKRSAAFAAAAFLIGFNASLVLRQDAVWFEYLSVRGERLAEISRIEGRGKKKVFIEDDFFQGDPNLNYFKDRLEFVRAEPGPESEVFRVDLKREKYQEYFGRESGKTYWFHPWFIKRECREDTPWC